ncbi:glycosyltransferase family 4 protein [Candidatus Daviesbacteria bacterium]|nr:glycosyltransferase family 4 protein [Candidatus Daviesbacteria bacterium]
MFRDYTFIIAFHEAIPIGPSFDLKKFLFITPPKKLFFISHPLLYNKLAYKNSSWYEYHENGRLIFKRKAFHWILPEPVHYIKDVLYTFFWCSRISGKFDVFVGLNPLNALVGILLKRFGKVKKVVYYSIDYFPQRFENSLMNNIYHSTDKLAVKFSDETWNVSPNMAISRNEYHHDPNLFKKQFTVPIVAWVRGTKRVKFNEIDKKKLVFIGLLDKSSGLELIIKALPKIINKIKNVKLEVIGGGPNLDYLKQLAKKFKVDSNIIFHDWIINREKVEEIISHSAVGLVLFNTREFGTEIKNADPMKIKDYMSLGLTIISTDAILTADEIIKAKSGIIIHFDVNELADAVIKLLGDEKLLKAYRKNALDYIKKFDAEKVFGDNLTRLLSV